MGEEKFEQYLKERYECQVQWYDERSSRNKWYSQGFQWAAIIISALVPVLVTLNPTQRWITITLSTVLAITTAALKTFKFEENWISYRTVAETLKKEKYYYDAGAIEYATAEDKKQLFVERVEALISSENTLWMAIQRKKEDKGTVGES
ncbi:MAG: DUF4231 domain-containing protein [Candidatus Poribacteria bacterium]|nr:DUF4231 domain-containing protein [Candidatus Poribacteria bacterium]